MLQISKLLNDQAVKRYKNKKQKDSYAIGSGEVNKSTLINFPSFRFLVLLGRTTLEFNLYKSFPQKDIQSLQCQKGITLDK